jgi:hypothetical protein
MPWHSWIILCPLQFIEVIKLENMGYREDMLMPGDVFLLQVNVTSSWLIFITTDISLCVYIKFYHFFLSCQHLL